MLPVVAEKKNRIQRGKDFHIAGARVKVERASG